MACVWSVGTTFVARHSDLALPVPHIPSPHHTSLTVLLSDQAWHAVVSTDLTNTFI